MSIFDDELVSRLKREAELKAQEDEEKMFDALEKKQIAREYITDCLHGFPAAAKKINLQTESLELDYASNKKHRKTIEVWKVAESAKFHGSKYYVGINGNCFEKSFSPSMYGGYHEYVSDMSIKLIAYKMYDNCDWCQGSKDDIKKWFIEVLSGKYV